MPDLPHFAVLADGFDGAAIAAVLMHAGIGVQVHDDDPDSVLRSQAYLARRGLEVPFAPGPVPPDAAVIDALMQVPLADVMTRTQGRPTLSHAHADAIAGRDMLGWHLHRMQRGAALVEATSLPETGFAMRRLGLVLTRAISPVACLVSRPHPGLLVGTLRRAMIRTADRLLLEATNPWELDEAMQAHHFDTGVLERQDQIGLDADLASWRAHGGGPLIILDRMVAEGRLGVGVGVGWYRYPGGGGKVIDPLLEDMMREEAWFAGITRIDLAPHEIANRMLVALRDAAQALRARGVAQDRALVTAARQGLGLRAGVALL